MKDMFESRKDAGKQLGEQLLKYRNSNTVIIGIPRGGVMVAYEVAKILNAPLGVVVVRKIGSPYNPELGIGAIAQDNVQVMNQEIIEELHITKKELKALLDKERSELERRIILYKISSSVLKGKTVIIVDDGLATGSTAQAAILALRKKKPAHIIFASPVCAEETTILLAEATDNIHCLLTKQDISSIGMYYRDFTQISDQTVRKLLQKK